MKKSYFLEKNDLISIIAEKFNTLPENVKLNQYSANVMIEEDMSTGNIDKEVKK